MNINNNNNNSNNTNNSIFRSRRKSLPNKTKRSKQLKSVRFHHRVETREEGGDGIIFYSSEALASHISSSSETCSSSINTSGNNSLCSSASTILSHCGGVDSLSSSIRSNSCTMHTASESNESVVHAADPAAVSQLLDVEDQDLFYSNYLRVTSPSLYGTAGKTPSAATTSSIETEEKIESVDRRVSGEQQQQLPLNNNSTASSYAFARKLVHSGDTYVTCTDNFRKLRDRWATKEPKDEKASKKSGSSAFISPPVRRMDSSTVNTRKASKSKLQRSDNNESCCRWVCKQSRDEKASRSPSPPRRRESNINKNEVTTLTLDAPSRIDQQTEDTQPVVPVRRISDDSANYSLLSLSLSFGSSTSSSFSKFWRNSGDGGNNNNSSTFSIRSSSSQSSSCSTCGIDNHSDSSTSSGSSCSSNSSSSSKSFQQLLHRLWK